MTNIFDYYDDKTYLAHHGIKGQKWGIRRFQNPDGTRTKAGKERYGSNLNNKKDMSEETKKKILKSAKIGAVVAGAVAISYGAYKLNKISVSSLRANDLKIARDWLQKSNVLTDTVDDYIRASFRSGHIQVNGKSAAILNLDNARKYSEEAQKALGNYRYYSNRANFHNYSGAERIDELKRLIRNL